MARDGAGHQQQVGVPRAGDEMDPVALEVVVGVVQRLDLEFAAVAGAGIDLADRQRATEHLADPCLQLAFGPLQVGEPGRRLAEDAGAGDVLENVEHGRWAYRSAPL